MMEFLRQHPWFVYVIVGWLPFVTVSAQGAELVSGQPYVDLSQDKNHPVVIADKGCTLEISVDVVSGEDGSLIFSESTDNQAIVARFETQAARQAFTERYRRMSGGDLLIWHPIHCHFYGPLNSFQGTGAAATAGDSGVGSAASGGGSTGGHGTK